MNSKTNITNPESVLEECSNVKVKYTKYTEYGKMLEPHIENIKSIVDKSSNGEAIVSTRNMANVMNMNEKCDYTIYRGIRYIMWQHGVAVDSIIHKDRVSELLVFRSPIDGEKLPDGLARDKTNSAKYRDEFAKKKGYNNYNEYRNGLVKKRGYNSYNEYLNELAKKKGCKNSSEYYNKMNHKNGKCAPFNKNKECSLYLGIHIAEKILPLIFENVETMPYGNRGYDYICSKGHKIDVKSSSLLISNNWVFGIKRNKVADYFLMEAFDNRYNLNIMHIWLVRSNEVIRRRKLNDIAGLAIINSKKSLEEFKEYEITDKLDDIQKVCNEFREAN